MKQKGCWVVCSFWAQKAYRQCRDSIWLAPAPGYPFPILPLDSRQTGERVCVCVFYKGYGYVLRHRSCVKWRRMRTNIYQCAFGYSSTKMSKLFKWKCGNVVLASNSTPLAPPPWLLTVRFGNPFGHCSSPAVLPSLPVPIIPMPSWLMFCFCWSDMN